MDNGICSELPVRRSILAGRVYEGCDAERMTFISDHSFGKSIDDRILEVEVLQKSPIA